MDATWPELSDLLVDTDPVTLRRRPVHRAAVAEVLRRQGMREAGRILSTIPGDDVLDESAIDDLLVRSHAELQRLGVEFRNGERLRRLLAPLLDVLRQHVPERPLRVVDIGCGLGFVLRWLAAHGQLGDDVELVGCDYNPTFIALASKLSREEGLRCEFRVADALALERRAHVFLSTGVLHHFRGDALGRFLGGQAATAAAMLHCDIKASWAAPFGSWVFHHARMREPLARHDGVLSAVRAHPGDVLLSAARNEGRPLRYALLDGAPSPLPILRTLQVLVGLQSGLESDFRAALGPMARRLGEFA